MTKNWTKLSEAWHKDFLPIPTSASLATPSIEQSSTVIKNAIKRTLPLLNEDPTAVPFVCRYRADVIEPLTTKQVHQLSDYIQKYDSLSSLRKKILDALVVSNESSKDSTKSRVETSISKSELEDIYAPFKPPSKGSLEDRIRVEHPQLVEEVNKLWNGELAKNAKLKPRDKAVTLLANRIGGDVLVMDAIMEYSAKKCRLQVKQVSSSTRKKEKAKINGENGKKTASSDGKLAATLATYNNFEGNVSHLHDHQVLAIRRGADRKMLKLSFEINNAQAERVIKGALLSTKNNSLHQLYPEAIVDSWNRLLRRRCTSRLWKQQCQKAEERAIDVFCDNLKKALLAPPTAIGGRKVLLALDPGFQAGIKCAILSQNGEVVGLDTVKFMGSAREDGKQKLITLLNRVKDLSKCDDDGSSVCVVLGNGHGTREARQLLNDAANEIKIKTDVNLVSEAGASVWSVTEAAGEEFPNQTAASIAVVSIGRRFLNPLNELIKIPPKSLGLGMYQHDLSEKVLEDKLDFTSVDSVAEVGVDVNSCSLEILKKVPSLTPSLCTKVIKARPFKARDDLLKVSGLGPKTFENCAAFIRVVGGNDPLDSTLVHPESYDLARWLLKKFGWKLGDVSSVGNVANNERQKMEWKSLAQKAATKFNVSEDRVYTVIGHLFFSITNPDPRLRILSEQSEHTTVGATAGCSPLPSHISTEDELRKNVPIRKITATVRNVVDFGAFVDIGLENDCLLHRSKIGSVPLSSLLVGQDIGIDILGVSKSNRVSIGLAGLDLPVDDLDSKRPRSDAERKIPTKRQRKRK